MQVTEKVSRFIVNASIDEMPAIAIETDRQDN
jgi:hypothetical protein